MEAVILAGGLGTRLAAVLPGLPKPMAPIGDRPFLQFVLELLARNGFQHLVLSVGYGAKIIRGYFGTSFEGLTLTYVEEQEPLGTGGALAQAVRAARSSSIFVLNGDTYLELDFYSMSSEHLAKGAHITMAVSYVSDTSRYGRITLDQKGEIVSFGENAAVGPGLINSGVYVIDSDLFAHYRVPLRFSLERDFLAQHLIKIRPRGFITDGYFIDIGVPSDWEKAQCELPRRTRA